MRRISIQEQKEIQLLEHLVRRYPEQTMQTLAAIGVERFAALYKKVTGIDNALVCEFSYKIVDERIIEIS